MRDRALGSTIRLKFTTTDSNGAPVAPSAAFAASDFRIYKDGSATEKATTNGITVTSPFDSVTGRHLIEIDTSNSTGDTGFWASGSAYFVELNTAKTVNSQSVSGLEIGSFSLELQTADIRKANGTAITAASGRMEVNTTHFGGTAQTARDIGASVLLSSGTGTGQVLLTSGTVTAGTVSDKTGYSLASGGLSAISTWTVAITGNITGNLSGSVGSVTGNVGGNVVGSVASVTNRVTANTDQWNGVTVTGMPMPTYTQPTGFLAATFPSTVASTTNITAASGVSLSAGSISSIQSGLATAANQSTLIDYAGYTLSVLSGEVTGAQTSSETYAIALGGSTYTVAMAGLTSTGTRTAPTLTKT